MNEQRRLPISDEQLRDALTGRPDAARMSEGLSGIMAAAQQTPQRRSRIPGWLVAERWLPEPILTRRTQITRAVVVLVTLLLLVALVLAAFVVAGSRQRLPAPYGLAKPGLIAYDAGGDLYVAQPDGSGRVQLTSGHQNDTKPTFSPDGTRIAYLAIQPDLSMSVVVMDVRGRNPVTIASGLAGIEQLSWAPDSRRIGFAGWMAASTFDQRIYAADVDHPGAVALGGPDLYGNQPSWSPDGSLIAFRRQFDCCSGTASDGAWLMDADGSDPRPLTSTPGTGVSLFNWSVGWSPDGKHIAFVADGPSGSYDVYTIGVDGSGLLDVTNSAAGTWWPSWSPDGTMIAAATNTPGLDVQHLLIVRADGSGPTAFDGTSIDPTHTPVWSPDGKRVLMYASQSGSDDDTIVSFDASGQTPPLLIPVGAFTGASWQRLAP